MLEFQNITARDQDRLILDDFSLSVPDGVIMGLVGSDSEARSCLLSIAGGVRQPDLGQVILDGNVMDREDIHRPVSDLVGYMPGQYGFYKLLRLEEYFEFFFTLHKVNSRYWEKKTREVLELISMEEYEDFYINEIPPDKYPFLCLGKTLLHDPSWLILDDPFANLDVSGRNQMLQILLELHEQGKSILIHSQMFPELLEFYTDIAVIENGRLVSSGLIQDVYEVALSQSPVRMHVLSGLDEALAVLKMNHLVERVTVNGMDVIFRFNGDAMEEAELLSDLVKGGALIQNYMRNRVNIEQIFQGVIG
ncbi:MAG: hypothetical protein IJ137_03995 [Eubacterium sp.]|nr:hypothetical protein [Eubacterium sp.]